MAKLAGFLNSWLFLTLSYLIGAVLYPQPSLAIPGSNSFNPYGLAMLPLAPDPELVPVLPPMPDAISENGTVLTQTATPMSGYEPGELLLKLKAPLGERVRRQLLIDATKANAMLPLSLQRLNQRYGLTGIKALFPQGMKIPNQVLAELPPLEELELPKVEDMFVLYLSVATPLDIAAQEYSNEQAVEFAEPNYRMQIMLTPNDEFYTANYLWGLDNIDASLAWNLGTGANVLVAVVDTGVFMQHPDLQANIYTNSGETPGNGVDDDGNGYIDDVHGWDFVSNDNDPSDGNGHGTHVAGTIAAVGNNTYGVVGLAFQAQILPVKGLSDAGYGNEADLVQAMVYAANNGAVIMNNSWGGSGQSAVFQTAVDYAYGLGVLVISAAGNNSQDAVYNTPANVENSMAVSSVTNLDALSSFSNYGVIIDVSAPGGTGPIPSGANPYQDVLSTAPPSSQLETSGFPIFYGGDLAKYMPLYGTSMAAPHVSGLAALILGLHPTWTHEQVKQAIRQSAIDLAPVGFDTSHGYGRINAYAAMTLSYTPPAASLREPRTSSVLTGTVTVEGVATSANFSQYILELGVGQTPTSFTSLYSSGTQVPSGTLYTWNTIDTADNNYTLRLRTLNTLSQQSEDRNYLTVDNVFIASPVAQSLFVVNTTPTVTILGQVPTSAAPNGPHLQYYTLEWASGINPAPGSFFTIVTSTTPVYPTATLATWSILPVLDGDTTLRLTAVYDSYTEVHDVVVIIDQLMIDGWPATCNNPNSHTFKSPLVADLDGNGTKEIILGSAVFQADGSLRPGWTSDPSLGRSNPAIVDIDNDGRREVVAATFTQWYSGPQFSTEPNYGAPVIRAFNADNSLDPQGPEDWSYAVENPDTGPEYNSGVISSICVEDVDGDQDLEVVFLIWFNWGNTLHETTVFVLDAASGALETRVKIAGTSFSAPALADLNGDGAAEIIISTFVNSADDYLHVLNGNGTPVTWGTWPQLFDDEASGASDPVVGDVDLDGDLEVLLGKQLFHHTGVLVSGWPALMIGRSTGAIAPLPDGDPNLELVRGGGNHVVLTVHDDDATMKYMKSCSGENLYVFMAGENPRQGNPIVADIDGDNEPEVFRSHEMGFTDGRPLPIYGCEGNSSATPARFPRRVIEPAMIVRSTCAVEDINDDGATDVLVAAGGQIYAWCLRSPYNPANNPWPMYQHDYYHTGNRNFVVPPPASPIPSTKTNGLVLVVLGLSLAMARFGRRGLTRRCR